MKIAVLVGRLDTPSETFIRRELSALRQAGHTVHATATLECGAAPPSYAPLLAALTRAPARQLLRRHPVAVLRRLPILARQVSALPRPDLILAHFAGVPALHSALLAAAWSRPFVVSAHARDVFVPWAPGITATRHAARVVVCNRCAQEALLKGLPEIAARTHLCHHSVPPEYGRIVRTPSDRPLVLAAGRFVPKKGFDHLLQALAQAIHQLPQITLRLLGCGPDTAALQALTGRLGLRQHVVYPGFLSADRMPAELAQAHVLVAPSVVAPDGDRDGIPNIVLEAMAAGLPVVAGAAGGLPEIVQAGQTGQLVDARNHSALATAIISACTDASRWHPWVQAARERVHIEFDPAATTRGLLSILTEATRGDL